jgi:hypothetical protein
MSDPPRQPPGRGGETRPSPGQPPINAPGFDHDRWKRLHDHQLDLDVIDPDGHDIGLAGVHRRPASFFPDWVKVIGPGSAFIVTLAQRLRFGGWWPVDGFRHVLVGQLDHYAFFNPRSSGDEAHFNIFIQPDPAFRRLMDEVKDLMTDETEHYLELARRVNQGTSHPSDVPFPVGDPPPVVATGYPLTELHRCRRVTQPKDPKPGEGVFCIECEVTPDQKYYDNVWFPTHVDSSPLVGRTMGVYGPWVRDYAHGGRPEIHPCEVIWWRNGSLDDPSRQPHVLWRIIVLQDDSNRFDSRSDYEGSGRLWLAAPRRAHLTMSLQAPRGRRAEYVVSVADGLRIFEHPGEQARSVSTSHESGAVLTVTKQMSKPAQLKTRLGPMRSDPARPDRLRCFLELDIQVGEGSRGTEGFAELIIDHFVPVAEPSRTPPSGPAPPGPKAPQGPRPPTVPPGAEER